MTAGSCFAQHVGNALRKNGFSIIDTEPMPDICPKEIQTKYGYGLYSARYGNVYSLRQFLQLTKEAHGLFRPSEPVGERNGRYYDAQRPGVEPEGYETPEDVIIARRAHLEAVRSAFAQADLIVFTLGLTEAWEHIESGTVYPRAPRTIGAKSYAKAI